MSFGPLEKFIINVTEKFWLRKPNDSQVSFNQSLSMGVKWGEPSALIDNVILFLTGI
jgi:hypothetical protein